VESQGGTIRAESELNAGSNFLVTLPRVEEGAGT
jgi:signal transduction histidine kinase